MKSNTEEVEIICAWCNKLLGVKEMETSSSMKGTASHSICKVCFDKQKKELKNAIA